MTTMLKSMKFAVLSLAFSLICAVLSQNALQAGERGGGMMTLRPDAALRMKEDRIDASLRLLHRHIRLAGINTKKECEKSSDCERGEVCCKVSGLETYCATPDECFGEPIKD